MLHAEETQHLKRISLWLRGLLAQYKELWQNFEQIKSFHNEDCGNVHVAEDFTPITIVAMSAMEEEVDYILELDEAAENALRDGNTDKVAEFTEELQRVMDIFAVQWVSLHRANCALFSVWGHMGAPIKAQIPPATIEAGEPRPTVIPIPDAVAPPEVH